MRILSLSDTSIPFIYSPQAKRRFQGVNVIVGCGDLPYYYLEYIYNALDAPLYYVRGNHDEVLEYSSAGQRTHPHGGIDLHRHVVNEKGLLLAGVEGCLRYRPGPFQYSQSEMWAHVFSLAPGLVLNRGRYGRYLDVFVTHAPASGLHDCDDLPHRGIDAFRWFIKVFQPRLYLHGHIHVYRPDAITETYFGPTRVVNTFGYKDTDLAIDR